MTTQTKTTWQKVKLEEIVDFQYGYTASAQDVDTGTKLLRITDIVPDLIDWDVVPYCAIDEKKLEQFKIKKGDILIARTGATAGYAKLIRREPEQSVFASYLIRLEMKNENISPDFIGRIIESDAFKNFVSTHAGGSAQPHANTPVLKNFEISLPDLLTQNQIAGVLSTYDDLIENNTKRIKILEEIVQAIYREWFEKNAKFKNQNAKLSEIVKPQYGYTESASDEKIGPKYLRGTDINKNSYIDWSTVPYCKISDEDKKKYQLQKNDIVVIRMADPGKIGMVEQDVDAVFASYLIRLKIIDERVSPYYLFYFLNSDQYQNYIQGASGGTTRKSASAGVVTGIDIAIPPKDLVDKFEAKISLLRSELNNLLVQNAKLRQARDLLLPKLITGEIEVKNS